MKTVFISVNLGSSVDRFLILSSKLTGSGVSSEVGRKRCHFMTLDSLTVSTRIAFVVPLDEEFHFADLVWHWAHCMRWDSSLVTMRAAGKCPPVQAAFASGGRSPVAATCFSILPLQQVRRDLPQADAFRPEGFERVEGGLGQFRRLLARGVEPENRRIGGFLHRLVLARRLS